MELGLEDDTVFITGSSRGIGAGIARAFLTEGAKVAISGRGKESLEQKRAELVQDFGEDRVIALACDLTDVAAVEQAADQVIAAFGKLNHLILNIGDGRSVPDAVPPAAHWNVIMDANFNSAVAITRIYLPLLEQQENSSILFISSIAGCEAFGAPVDYSTAKAAVNAFSKNLAGKVASSGVRVNTLAPGNVLFPGGSWEEKLQQEPERYQNLIEMTVPMKRFGKVEEMADAALFLCSRRASFITGSLLKVDGGQTFGI
jgi:3-oxoacyl-[acyl-carrier protein] reductase